MNEPAAPDAAPAETTPRSSGARSLARRLVGSRIVFVAWVALATVLLVSIAFRATTTMGPGQIQVRAQPSTSGYTELAVPPLGAVRASTHRAPIALDVELREVDLLGALDPADGARSRAGDDATPADARELGAEELREIEDEVYADLGEAVRHVVLLALGAAAFAGAAAALAFPGRRSLRRVGLGAVIGPITVALITVPVVLDYDASRFETQPEFVGPLAAAPELVQRVGSLETRFGSVESRTRVLAERVAGLYSSVVTAEIDRSEGEVVLLHVSDLHLNAVGLSLAQQLARSFAVDAVVDTGDITSFGFAPEAGFIDLLEGFEVPYYLVAGNHDSMPVRRQFAESDAVTFLDDEVVDIAGVRVLGVSDPTVTALRTIPVETLERTYRQQYASTRRLVAAEQPDLLLVHNPVQARPVLGRVPAVAAGHTHRTRLQVIDGTVVAIVGSSGATGLGDLLVEENAPYRFQLLRFLDGTLVAVDHVELDGAAGDFVLQRRLIRPDEADTDDELVDDEVDEPARDALDDEQLDRVTSTTSTTEPGGTDPSSTAPTSTEPGG